MSRIGKKVITLPANTTLTVSGSSFAVKGPQGELSRALPSTITLTVNGSDITVAPTKLTLESKALWGTTAAHVKNMIAGVNAPFTKKLILEGIGYKSEVKGDKIVFALGFSHPVAVSIPKSLKVAAEKNVISISGADKEEVGQFAANLRALKKPEPYKGKGMRYDTETIRRKQGKKSV